MHADLEERRHDAVADAAERRVEGIMNQGALLKSLLVENTELTKQDKQLTEEVARLTRAIHELLASGERRQAAP